MTHISHRQDLWVHFVLKHHYCRIKADTAIQHAIDKTTGRLYTYILALQASNHCQWLQFQSISCRKQSRAAQIAQSMQRGKHKHKGGDRRQREREREREKREREKQVVHRRSCYLLLWHNKVAILPRRSTHIPPPHKNKQNKQTNKHTHIYTHTNKTNTHTYTHTNKTNKHTHIYTHKQNKQTHTHIHTQTKQTNTHTYTHTNKTNKHTHIYTHKTTTTTKQQLLDGVREAHLETEELQEKVSGGGIITYNHNLQHIITRVAQ